MKRNYGNRKAQEEITGFIIIVLFVTIVILVLGGFFMYRLKDTSPKDSQEISQFLDSIMEYSSDCAKSYEPNYLKINELISACDSGISCVSGETACSSLNRTLRDLIKSNWRASDERYIKGYLFDVYHKRADGTRTQVGHLTPIFEGSCGSTAIRKAEVPISGSTGDIIVKFEICLR